MGKDIDACCRFVLNGAAVPFGTAKLFHWETGCYRTRQRALVLPGLFMIDQATGEFLLVATIRLAIVCYFSRLLVVGCRVIRRVPTLLETILWTLGCAAYLIHVVCAFAFAHDWSHAIAFEYTADETQRLFGVHRGEGLWVNYLFTSVWGFDVVRLTVAFKRKQPTDRKQDIAVHAFMAFIVFNATVVFGPSLYRYLAVPVGIAMYASYRRRKRASV